MSLMDRYFSALRELLERVQTERRADIEAVARLCAESIAAGGVVHIFDTGHLVDRELINRAGGLVGLTAFRINLQVENTNSYRAAQGSALKPPLETYSVALNASNIRAGDVLIVGSVSGKTANVIELALRARERGVKVVALTSVAYSSRLKSEHPSGKRLFEAAEWVLDNGAPYGDGMLAVEGLDYPLAPASGLGAVMTLWAVVTGIVEELTERGLAPSVFPSVNRPDGPAEVEAVRKRYQEKGY
jgi:uncharacterized phosphosugar-binding protein